MSSVAATQRGRRRRRPACFPFLGLILAGSLVACATGAPAPGAAAVVIAPQRDWSDAVIYSVLIDRYADGDARNDLGVERGNPGGWHGGDLKGLAAQLDEIADLGATAIWINPVVKQVEPPMPAPGFRHYAFHGYWADDFERLDPHFGSEEDLRALVDAAHARGLKVLIDVVYNHAGYGARYLDDPRTRAWLRTGEGDCSVDPVTCAVSGLPDFRTELPEVRNYLMAAHLGLARRVGADGFRLDTVKHVEHAFWDEHRARTRKELGPRFFLLGEVWGGSAESLDEWFAPDEMDAGFDFTFKGSCEGFVSGRGRVAAYAAYLGKRERVRAGHFLAHYLSSHDEPMALANLGGDVGKFELCVALQMTSSGIPVIDYGEEVGRQGGAWPENRRDMPWGGRGVAPGNSAPRNEALRAFYRTLIAVRRAHPALETGAFHALATDGDLLVFARVGPGDAVVVAVNRGLSEASARVPLPAGWSAGAVREALAGEPVTTGDGALAVTVPAGESRIYVQGGS